MTRRHFIREPKPRILGVDYGQARIGLALSDEQKVIATPYKTVTAEKKLEMTAKKLIEQIHLMREKEELLIDEIVIGMPLKMSGQKGMQADEVQEFVTILKTLTPIKITTWDERLTTRMAEKSLSFLNRKKRSQVIDTVSATVILQGYLDSLKKV